MNEIESDPSMSDHESTSAQRPSDPPGGRLRVGVVAPPYFDVPPAAYGGVEAVVADLIDALVQRGHQVTLFAAGRPGTKARFVPVWERTVPERLGQSYPEAMHAAATRLAVLEAAAGDGLDVVHEHTLTGPLNAAVYAAAGVPTVLTVHGPVDDDMYPYYRALGSDLNLIAISNQQRQRAPELNWIGTVHNGLDVEAWPFRDQKEDYALFLGRFHPQKAPHLALDAAHAAGVPLILAGKCSEPIEKEYFDREVVPRLTPTDHIYGVADAIAKRDLLVKARCLLFPVCWEEPFGMVMIEAMACGTPVVALRGGAVPEVVADGVTGIICDEPAHLARAVHDVANLDPAACRAHVAENFGVDNLARGYEVAYRTVMRRHRSTRPGPGPRPDAGKPEAARPGARARDAAPNRRRVTVRPAQSARR